MRRSAEMTFWSAFGLILIGPCLWIVGEISLVEALKVAGVGAVVAMVFGYLATRLKDW